MSTSTSVEPPRRVALVAERLLVGQAIAAALRVKDLVPMLLDWPQRRETRAFRQRVARTSSSVGVVLCDLRSPDLLRDVEMVVGSGMVHWMVLTDSEPGPRWGSVLAAGAVSVLPTTTSTAGLALAVRETLKGRATMPPALRERVLGEWEEVAEEQRELVHRMERLTHREYEVLGQLFDGEPVQRIAAASGVAESTVRSQVKSLRRKLGVDSQLAAVAMYRRALEVFPRARR